MPFVNGVVSVGTGATKICTVGPAGVFVQNLGAQVVYIGGANVTANTAATGGVQLAAAGTSGDRQFIPGGQQDVSGSPPNAVEITQDLYGIVTATTANVAFVAAS